MKLRVFAVAPFLPKAPRSSRALVASAALLALAGFSSVGRAQMVTYNINDFPTAEIDSLSGDQDIVSGTITAAASDLFTSFTAGVSGSQNDPSLVTLSFDVTIRSSDSSLPWVTYTGEGPLTSYLGSGTVNFTADSILLGGYIVLNGTGTSGNSGELYWRPDIDAYMGYVIQPGSLSGPEVEFSDSPATPLDPAPWTIASAVPEPSAANLAALGGAAFVLLSRKRSRSKA